MLQSFPAIAHQVVQGLDWFVPRPKQSACFMFKQVPLNVSIACPPKAGYFVRQCQRLKAAPCIQRLKTALTMCYKQAIVKPGPWMHNVQIFLGSCWLKNSSMSMSQLPCSEPRSQTACTLEMRARSQSYHDKHTAPCSTVDLPQEHLEEVQEKQRSGRTEVHACGCSQDNLQGNTYEVCLASRSCCKPVSSSSC